MANAQVYQAVVQPNVNPSKLILTGMTPNLDHLVVGAGTLEQGVTYVKEQLGVAIPKGGEHPSMGTHNHLMQLGGNAFLEVIAINPDAPAPDRPRWYGLDDPFVRGRLERQPQLLSWVINTSDLKGLQAQTSFSFGEATEVSRGDLSWHFGIPDDGRLLASGMLPYLIQWHTNMHPAKRMDDVGCTLKQLELHHPQPKWLLSILNEIDATKFVEVKKLDSDATPFIEAHIETPTGVKTLSSRS